MNALHIVWKSLNDHATTVLGVGVLAAVVWNWWQWRKDRALALRLRAEGRESVPLIPCHSERSEESQVPKGEILRCAQDDTASTLLPADCSLLTIVPKVSVLVAAWNEADTIHEHIESFLRLRYPNKELILCAGGMDGTYDIARQYIGDQVVVVEQQPGEGKQRALQRCLEKAGGEVIFLTDADCLLDDDSFERTLAPLVAGDEEAASGASCPLMSQLPHPFVVYQWRTDLYVQARQAEFSNAVLGRNCALRRGVLEGVGGFSAPVRTGTDYYLGKQLLRGGHRIRYVRDSAVHTRYPETVRSYWRRQSRWVRNLMVHGPTCGAFDEVRAAFGTALVGTAMLVLPILGLVAGPIMLVVWGVLLAQAFVAKLRYAQFARLYQSISIPGQQYGLIPLYLFVDFVAWTLPLVDLVVRRHQW